MPFCIQTIAAIDLLGEGHQTPDMESPENLSCDDYLNMPFSEAVIGHIQTCGSCLALFRQLADDLDRRLLEHQHRN
jgi:hypothetical protein